MIEHRVSSGVSEFRCLEFVPSGPRPADLALVYLHGAGERGADITLVKRYGLPALLARGSATVNCTVICPQLEAEREWEPERLARFISSIRDRYARVGLIGYSLGGIGVCEVLTRYGAVATPAIAIAAQARGIPSVSQAGVTFVAIQGELDSWATAGPLTQSITSHGGIGHEVVLAGQGHYISELALEHPLLQSVMRSFGFEIALRDRAHST